MKKIIAFLLLVLIMFSLVGCGGSLEKSLVTTFEDNADKTPQEITDSFCADVDIPFDCKTSEVKEGELDGFRNEIDGFVSASKLSPTTHTNPFVTYVFELEEGADVDAFVDKVTTEANPNWNPYEPGDEPIVETDGNKVIVIIPPLEIPTVTEGEMVSGGDDFNADFE